MILADSAVWIDHLRRPDAHLTTLLSERLVIGHAFVTGEVALGSLKDRRAILGDLGRLRQLPVARVADVAMFIDRERLYSLGIGYVDAHLLASVRLVPGTRLLTRDRRLGAVAERLGIAAPGNDP